MDVTVLLASALAGWPAILGMAQGYVWALVVVAEALSRWMAAIVMALACVAFFPSGAHAETGGAEVPSQMAIPAEESLIATASGTDRKMQKSESEQLGSAIYSPFSAGAIARQEQPSVASAASIAPEQDLTMTLVASAGGAIALAWLLYRI